MVKLCLAGKRIPPESHCLGFVHQMDGELIPNDLELQRDIECTDDAEASSTRFPARFGCARQSALESCGGEAYGERAHIVAHISACFWSISYV